LNNRHNERRPERTKETAEKSWTIESHRKLHYGTRSGRKDFKTAGPEQSPRRPLRSASSSRHKKTGKKNRKKSIGVLREAQGGRHLEREEIYSLGGTMQGIKDGGKKKRR